MALERIKALPQCASVLEGERKEAIMELFKKEGRFTHLGGSRLVLSADLTAASDNIPHEQA
jgi:hypothetical protein